MSFVTGRKVYLKNLSSSYLPYFAQIVITIIITPMLINTFGQERYGVYVLLNTFIAYFTLSNIGLPQTLIREIIHAREEENHTKINQMISSTFFYYLIAIAGVFLINVLFFYIDIFNLNTKILSTENISLVQSFSLGMLLVSILFGIRLITEIFDAIIKATNKIYITQIVKLINVVLLGVSTFVALKIYGSIEAVLIANTIASFLVLFILIAQSKKLIDFTIDLKLSSFQVFKEMLPSSFWYFMSGITVLLIFQTDTILISTLVSIGSVAIYALYYQFNNFAINIFQQIYTIRFSEIAKLNSKNQFYEIKRIFIGQLKIVIIFIIFYNIFMFNFGLEVFSLWIDINQNEILFKLIVFVLSTSLLGVPAGIICGALGIHKNIVIVNLLNGVLNLLVSLYLIKIYGIYGAIIGTGIATLLTGFWYNNYYLIKYIKKLEKDQNL